MKWFVSGTVVVIGSSVAASTVSSATGVRMLEDAGFWLSLAGIVSLPVAVGVAILRHRLYDIDVIINRVLVYGLLTAALVAVYVGGVLLLQALSRAFGGESTLAIVASTLAIAIPFNPLIRVMHGFIGRRFYRKKYDAASVLAAFSAALRDAADFGRPEPELLVVVHEMLRPEHASLWLRGPAPHEGKERDA